MWALQTLLLQADKGVLKVKAVDKDKVRAKEGLDLLVREMELEMHKVKQAIKVAGEAKHLLLALAKVLE